MSSSYAKILGETNFYARKIPWSGWKVEGGEEKKRKKRKKKKVVENNGRLRFRPPPQVAHTSCLDQLISICPGHVRQVMYISYKSSIVIYDLQVMQVIKVQSTH